MQFLTSLSLPFGNSSTPTRKSTSTSVPKTEKRKLSAAEDYWTNPVLSAGFGLNNGKMTDFVSATNSAVHSRRNSMAKEEKAEKEGKRKMSAAEAYWSDPVLGAGFPKPTMGKHY
jgi:hypothetical protein